MLENDAYCCPESPSQTDRQIMILFTTLQKKNISQEERGTKKAFRCSGTEQNWQGRHPSFIDLRKSNKIQAKEVELSSLSGQDEAIHTEELKFLNIYWDQNGPENKPFSPCKLIFTCGTE